MNRPIKELVLASTIVASLALPIYAETAEDALASRFRAAEALMDAQLARESVPGAAIGIVHDQNLIWSHQFGVESLRTKRPVSDDTLFSICSVSKLFTGIATMNLVEEGKIELDAPLARYNGGLAVPDKQGSEEPVTARGILSHVAGLPREGVTDYWSDTRFPDAAALHKTMQAHEQLYQPYNNWQYSNLGMAMLGDAIGQVSGTSWANYVEQNIFQPLGMTGSVTDMPFDRVGKGFAQGYYMRSAKGKRKPVEKHQFKAFAPAAGVASSVNDLAKFASWHFRLHDNGGEEVLKATTLRNMQRVHWMGADFNEPAWGLAYGAQRFDDKTLWGHGGYCPGARTAFTMRLPTKVGVAMMVSVNDVSPGAMVKTIYSLTEGAIANVHGKKADDAGKSAANVESTDGPAGDSNINLAEFEGTYHQPNYASDFYVGVNEDGLFSLPLFSADPVKNMETWVHEKGDRFRRKRKDDTLAEAVSFKRNSAGAVIEVIQHSYRSLRR